jgi:hypothetical protein
MYNKGGSTSTLKILRPDWRAESLWCKISDLLYMDYHRAKYGAILYERIGRIVFRVNDRVRQEFELGNILERLRFSDKDRRRVKVRGLHVEVWRDHVAREGGEGVVRETRYVGTLDANRSSTWYHLPRHLWITFPGTDPETCKLDTTDPTEIQ